MLPTAGVLCTRFVVCSVGSEGAKSPPWIYSGGAVGLASALTTYFEIPTYLIPSGARARNCSERESLSMVPVMERDLSALDTSRSCGPTPIVLNCWRY
jgi:hypothetical protein